MPTQSMRSPFRTALRLAAALSFGLTASCGQSATDPAPAQGSGPTTGSLTVTVSGLPSGVTAAVTVTGPGGFSQTLTATQTLTGLTPGDYTVAASAISGAQGTHAPSAASQIATVAAGATANTTVTYAEQFGSVSVSVSGLPSGVPAKGSVTGGPGGFAANFSGSTTFSDLPTGQYSVTANSVSSGQDVYDPNPGTQTVTVTANQDATAPIGYAAGSSATTGTVEIVIDGLPSGVTGNVMVLLSGALVWHLFETATDQLSAGDYTIDAFAVTSNGVEYLPQPQSQGLTVTGGGSHTVTVTYVGQLGTLDVAVSGVSAGAPSLTVSGPNGYQATLSGSGQLTGLAPGDYTIKAESITSPSVQVALTRSQVVQVSPGQTAAAAVQYVPFAFTAPLRTVAVSPRFTCALNTSGEVRCWGENNQGQFGNGATSSSAETSPIAGGNGVTLTQIAAGELHTCGLDASGLAYCWGDNQYGQLGDGSNTDSTVPVLVDASLAFTEISAAYRSTCALDPSGQAYCWGSNNWGVLGDGTTSDRNTPTPVGGGRTFVDLEAYGRHTCAIDDAGAAWCWGNNFGGQLGTGTSSSGTAAFPQPLPVVDGHEFDRLGSSHGEAQPVTCALKVDGQSWCWGDNGSGQIGDPSVPRLFARPAATLGGHSFVALALGDDVCGIDVLGDGYCWGQNLRGQYGDGTSGVGGMRAAFSGIAMAGIVVGDRHSCGVDGSGTLYCWGSNTYGALGDGTFTDRLMPTAVLPLN